LFLKKLAKSSDSDHLRKKFFKKIILTLFSLSEIYVFNIKKKPCKLWFYWFS